MAEGGQRLSRYETRTCPVCGEEFRTSEPTRKYCSLTCRRKANDEHRGGRPPWPTPPKEE